MVGEDEVFRRRKCARIERNLPREGVEPVKTCIGGVLLETAHNTSNSEPVSDVLCILPYQPSRRCIGRRLIKINSHRSIRRVPLRVGVDILKNFLGGAFAVFGVDVPHCECGARDGQCTAVESGNASLELGRRLRAGAAAGTIGWVDGDEERNEAAAVGAVRTQIQW